MNKVTQINEVLKKLNMDPITNISDSIMSVYPYNLISDLYNESVVNFDIKQQWEWTFTDTSLIYEAGVYSYNLEDYKIHYNKILDNGIYYIDNTTVQYITRMHRNKFKWNFPNVSTRATGRPLYYSMEGNVLYLSQVPDKDYGIKVRNYKRIPIPVIDTDSISIIPDKHQRGIVDYIAWVMSMIMELNIAGNQLDNFVRDIGQASLKNTTFRNKAYRRPSNIRW